MIKQPTLIALQACYACTGLAYLLLSEWRLQATGEALSAVPTGSSMVLFTCYSLTLLLPRFGFEQSYRVAMVIAVLLFCGSGVIGNTVRFLQSGLDHYASILAFTIAVVINLFGSVLNIIAAFGWYSRPNAGGARLRDSSPAEAGDAGRT